MLWNHLKSTVEDAVGYRSRALFLPVVMACGALDTHGMLDVSRFIALTV